MYIELTVTGTSYSFQKMDEEGISIGTPDTYLMSDYRLDFMEIATIRLIPASYAINTYFPGIPKAQYPKDRVILKS